MSRRVVTAAAAPAAIGPYSQAIAAGPFVFCSGQIPIDPATGELVPGGVTEQTEQVLRNVTALLAAEGLALRDVVKSTVFLVDLAQFAAMNAVYSRHFDSEPPARSTIQVSALPKGAQVEIEVTAVRPVI